MILQCQGHHPRTPIEFWNIDTQFSRTSRYINHPANLPYNLQIPPKQYQNK